MKDPLSPRIPRRSTRRHSAIGRRSLSAALVALIVCCTAPSASAHATWQRGKFAVFGQSIGNASDAARYQLLNDANIDFFFQDKEFTDLAGISTIRNTIIQLRNANPYTFTLKSFPAFGYYNGDAGFYFKNLSIYCTTPPLGSVAQRLDSNLRQPLFAQSFAEFPGFYVWDEPGSSCTNPLCYWEPPPPPPYPECMHLADQVTDIINHGYNGVPSLVADRVPYVNLLPLHSPSLANYPQCPGATEEERFQCYLERYLSTYNAEADPAPVLSVDHYPLQFGDTNDSRLTKYYLALKIQRDAALKYSRPGKRIPTWLWVQISKRNGTNPGVALTFDQVRWQIFSGLAYGMKGIGYWTLSPTPLAPLPDEVEVYGPGILNGDGTTTSFYTDVAALNAELRALGPTLVKLDPIATYHNSFGGQLGLGDQDDLTSGHRLYNIVDRITLDGVTATHAMVGYFKDSENGDDYLLVVNKERSPSPAPVPPVTPPLRRFRVHLTNGITTQSVKEVSKQDGTLVDAGLTSDYFETDLKPGEGRLFKIIDNVDEYLRVVRAIRKVDNQTYYGVQKGILLVDEGTRQRKFVSDPVDPLDVADLAITTNDVFAAQTFNYRGNVVRWDRALTTQTEIYSDYEEGTVSGLPSSIAVTSSKIYVGFSTPTRAGKVAVVLNRSNYQQSGAIDQTKTANVLDVEFQPSTTPPGIILATGFKILRYEDGAGNPTFRSEYTAKVFDVAVDGTGGWVYAAIDSVSGGTVSKFTPTLSGKVSGWAEQAWGRTRAVSLNTCANRVLAGSLVTGGTTSLYRWLNASTGALILQVTFRGNALSSNVSGVSTGRIGTSLCAGKYPYPSPGPCGGGGGGGGELNP